MNYIPLQKFDYLSSPYARPNDKWTCGRAREGKPCPLGPNKKGHCQATYECHPHKKDERWLCSRSSLHGGRCENGPLPDGVCCRKIERCCPTRSWRARRSYISRWFFVLCLGILVLLLFGSDRAAFISPGKLTASHAGIEDCKNCHSAFEKGVTHWLQSALKLDAGTDDSQRCLSCHVIKKNAQSPHNLDKDSLEGLTREATVASEKLFMPYLSIATGLLPAKEQHGTLTCALCHRQHQMGETNFSGIKEQRCQVCHTAQFESFATGHPEFNRFAYSQRTPINFDHTSHLYKHFEDEKYKDQAQKECLECHQPDAEGHSMLVDSFDAVCSGCHRSQIMGQERSGSKGVVVMNVPGLDLEVLRANDLLIGSWPVSSDEELTPLMALLLSADPAFVKAQKQLVDIDLMDLSLATEEQLKAVVDIGWCIKQFLLALTELGTTEIKRRLEILSEEKLSRIQMKSLLALPEDVLRSAQQQWFPQLMEEMHLFEVGDTKALLQLGKVVDKSPIPVVHDTEKQSKLTLESDELILEEELPLGENDAALFTEQDEDDPFAEEKSTEQTSIAPVRLEAEQWAAFGGWFRGDFSLSYAPQGHADPFLKHWIDYLASQKNHFEKRGFQALMKGTPPGACNKCHSISRLEAGGVTVNWASEDKKRLMVPGFTKFSHTSHFYTADGKGCENCHMIDKKADYAASYEQDDPHSFKSNFKPIQRQECTACHQQGLAGDTCLQCHNYHVTDILYELMPEKH